MSIVMPECRVRFVIAIASITASTVLGQGLGTINLPVALADAGATIQNMIPVKPQKIGYCEGPVVDSNGILYFSEQNAGIVWKITTAGAVSKWLTFTPAYANGLDIAPSGRIVVCEQTRITERDESGALVRVVTSGTTWGQGANDLSYASNGDLFFTAFNQRFWFHSADSSINRDYNFSQPSNIYNNGIEYLEEKGILYVCQWGQNRVMKYPVGANRVVDTGRKTTFATINGPDGITVDAGYNVYIASNSNSTGGIYVYDSSGTQLGTILMRQDNTPSSNASNCVFGGADNKTLYITGDSGAYKVQLKVAGRVRPNNSAVRPDQGRRHSDVDAPAISAFRSANGLRIHSSGTAEATVTIHTPSGRSLGIFPVDRKRPLYWQPPSAGIYILRASNFGAMNAVAVLYE